MFVDGANLSTGDMHFSQGDGEVTFCGAIEMSGFLDLKYIFYFIYWHSIHTVESRDYASILYHAYYLKTSVCFLKLLKKTKNGRVSISIRQFKASEKNLPPNVLGSCKCLINFLHYSHFSVPFTLQLL